VNAREILKVIEDEGLEGNIVERNESVKVGSTLVNRAELARLRRAQSQVDRSHAAEQKKSTPTKQPPAPKPKKEGGPSFEELGAILKAAGLKVPSSKKDRLAAVKALQQGKAATGDQADAP